jgi:hypothetical protein
VNELVFHRIEELRKYLETVPEGVSVRITVEANGDGKEDSEEIE